MAIMLNEALDYARRGWHVFPCREKPGAPYKTKDGHTIIPTEKQPYTSNGLHNATTDEDQITAWWTQWENALIGVNAGASGLFVVDIDKKHVNGLDTFMSWNINDSAGLHSITPSGGIHVLFSGKGKSTTNASTGIDTRGEGGYFIAPPSKILEGEYAGEYKRIDDWGKTPGVIPDGLMSKLFPSSTTEYVHGSYTQPGDGTKKQLSRATLNFLANGAAVGERNVTVFKALADFCGCGYTKEETRETVFPVCQRINFPESEFEQVLEHAYSKPRTASIPDSIQEKIKEGGKKIASKITPEEQRVMENALLACLLVDNTLIATINDILYSEDFQNLGNRLIYKAISRLYNSGMKADYITVSNEVAKETDKISLDDISKMINQYSVDTDNAVTYAYIIKEKASIKKLDSLMDNKNHYLKSGDFIQIVTTLEHDISDIALYGGAKSSSVLTAAQAMEQTAEYTKQLLSGQIDQLKTGFLDYDYHIGGIFSNEMIICAARAGDGKCLGYGTKIIMSDGSIKEVQDINKGDLLMGADSLPRTVLSIAQGKEMMYTIKQNRAISYRVNESHILSLKESSTEKNISQNGNVVNISVKDYLKLNKRKQKNLKGYKTRIEFPKKDLPIEPYFLGLWLGDGTSAKAQITNIEPEVINYIYDYAEKLDMRVRYYKQSGKCETYSISGGMKKLLSDIEVLDNKHIPFNYLTSSASDRLQLLAGLIDTDGSEIHNGYEITQKNKRLIDDIKYLADSLGFRTAMHGKVGTIKSIGFSGNYYRLTIYGYVDEIPVRVERKKIEYKKKRINPRVTGIQVIPDKVDDYYGFELSGDGLFLLEDFTVTHNTALMVSLLNYICLTQQKPALFFSLEMSTHECICRLICQLTGLPFNKVTLGRLKDEEWKLYREAEEKIKSSRLLIDDGFGQSIPEMRSKIRKYAEKEDLAIIAIDQLEQVRGYEGQPEYVRLDKLGYDIKGFNKEFNTAVMVNHQLNRGITDRRLKNPEMQLSDLNQAGEKPASQVWGIAHYKDEKGKILQSKIKLLKNRNGARIEFAVVFVGERMLFSNPVREEDKNVFTDKDTEVYNDTKDDPAWAD